VPLYRERHLIFLFFFLLRLRPAILWTLLLQGVRYGIFPGFVNLDAVWGWSGFALLFISADFLRHPRPTKQVFAPLKAE